MKELASDVLEQTYNPNRVRQYKQELAKLIRECRAIADATSYSPTILAAYRANMWGGPLTTLNRIETVIHLISSQYDRLRDRLIWLFILCSHESPIEVPANDKNFAITFLAKLEKQGEPCHKKK